MRAGTLAACLCLLSQPTIAQDAAKPDVPQAPEAALLRAHSDVARREGGRRSIGKPGYEQVFVDRPCLDDDGGCIEYVLDAAFSTGSEDESPIFGVHESYYEGHSYTLIDRGGMVETGNRPIVSPDGKLLVAAASSDNHPPDIGITLMRMDGEILWVLRQVRTGAVTNYTDLRWIGSNCVAFSGSAANAGFYGASEQFYLVAAEPEWLLTRDAALFGTPQSG